MSPLERVANLIDLVSVTFHGFSLVEKEAAELPPGKKLHLVDGNSGFLLDSKSPEQIARLVRKLQWYECGLVLSEWKSVVEDSLRELTLRRLGEFPDAKKRCDKILRSAHEWRANIQAELGIDIAPDGARVSWVAICEWVAIRNTLVHRGTVVDQRFLLEIRDLSLEKNYTLGRSFNILPGEMYHLLQGTQERIREWAAL
jgi:hypothetical protein